MPDQTEIAVSRLSPDGNRLLTPPLADPERFAYHIVLEGVFTFAYADVRFDALRKATGNGPFAARHDYLEWTPVPPLLLSEDPARHRAVFRVPANGTPGGQSVGVRVDVDRFVRDYLIAPSEVRSALAGEMTLTVLQIPLAPPSPWTLLAGASLPAALVAGGVGLVVRRRIALRGLSPDLQAALGRVENKVRATRGAASHAHGRLLPHLPERLDRLRRGAWALARQTADLRDAQRLLDPRALHAQIKKLERAVEAMNDAAAQSEGRSALEEKRKSLARLAEMRQAEELCVLRLAKIEAVLDSTCLALRGARATAATPASEESLRRALDAEVEAVAEVERTLAAARDEVQILGRGPLRPQ